MPFCVWRPRIKSPFSKALEPLAPRTVVGHKQCVRETAENPEIFWTAEERGLCGVEGLGASVANWIVIWGTGNQAGGVQVLHNQKSGNRTRAKRKGLDLTVSQQGLVTFLHLL